MAGMFVNTFFWNVFVKTNYCLAWLAWLALPWLGLACLSAWLALPSNNNSPPAFGGWRRFAPRLLLLRGKASQAERQAGPSQGKASQASQGKASMRLPRKVASGGFLSAKTATPEKTYLFVQNPDCKKNRAEIPYIKPCLTRRGDPYDAEWCKKSWWILDDFGMFWRLFVPWPECLAQLFFGYIH